jgi:hypothetical protein
MRQTIETSEDRHNLEDISYALSGPYEGITRLAGLNPSSRLVSITTSAGG